MCYVQDTSSQGHGAGHYPHKSSSVDSSHSQQHWPPTDKDASRSDKKRSHGATAAAEGEGDSKPSKMRKTAQHHVADNSSDNSRDG